MKIILGHFFLFLAIVSISWFTVETFQLQYDTNTQIVFCEEDETDLDSPVNETPSKELKPLPEVIAHFENCIWGIMRNFYLSGIKEAESSFLWRTNLFTSIPYCPPECVV